jgi:hypothetical protein
MEWRGCSAPKSGWRQRPFRRISRASSRDPCSGTNGHRVKRGALLSFSNRSSTVSILVVLVTSVKTDSTVPKPGGEYLWTLWVQGFCMSFIIFACCSCPSRPVLASSCFFLSDNLSTTIHKYHSQYYKQPSVFWCRRVLGLCFGTRTDSYWGRFLVPRQFPSPRSASRAHTPRQLDAIVLQLSGAQQRPSARHPTRPASYVPGLFGNPSILLPQYNTRRIQARRVFTPPDAGHPPQRDQGAQQSNPNT